MSKIRLSLDYIPRSTFNLLSRKAITVAREQLRLFNFRREVISIEHAHIEPSLKYLSRVTSLSRYQISRANTELHTAGIISRSQRRIRNGEWKTTVFKLGRVFTTQWEAFKAKKKGNKNTGLHNSANRMNEEALEDNYFGHFQEFIRNLGKGGMRPAPS